MRNLITILLIVTNCVFCFSQSQKQDTSIDNRNISRTLQLMATSTPEHRNKVHIIVYGQSISEQAWWLQVKSFILKEYPYADVTIENLAIGGFSSQLLWKSTLYDIIPAYPDLVIFHVLGSDKDYETIIRDIRTRTTSEILIQTDHIFSSQALADLIKHDADKAYENWENKMSFIYVPGFAEKYKCSLVKMRDAWRNDMETLKTKPNDYTRDGIHLNQKGMDLFAATTIPYLRYNPANVPDPYGLVKTFVIGKDIFFKKGKLNMEFEGNKIEFLSSELSAKHDTADILIDGKKPSDFIECYSFTRPNAGSGFPWNSPSFYHITNNTPLQIEDWKLTITSIDSTLNTSKNSYYYTNWHFNVEGSKTGFDGTGQGSEDFISNSGRVKISKEDWHIKQAQSVMKSYRLKSGDLILWKVKPLFTDKYVAQKVQDPSLEYTTNIIQGIPNGKHTLQIKTRNKKAAQIKGIRVYRPCIKTDMQFTID